MNKYSVGNRVFHTKHGEGMVSNVNNNTLEVLFLNGGKLLFQINDQEISILSTQEIKISSPTQPQGKNQVSFSPVVNKKNDNEFTVGSRVMHIEYGEGMVTKVTKNEVEVIFLNDSKYSFLKNSGEITTLPSLISKITNSPHYSDSKSITKPVIAKVGLTTGSRIFHKTYGEGMVSKISDNKVEIIFLDGSKQNFSKDNNEILPIEISESEIISIPQILKQETSTTAENSNKPAESKLGNQIFHPQYGEGMVSKIHKNDYEVIFVDGRKMTLPKNEFSQRKSNTSIPITAKTENYSDKNVNSKEPEISYNNPIVGKHKFHKRFGEALIVGVGNDVYEVMFLDGKKLVLPQNQFSEALEQNNNHTIEDKTIDTPVFFENKKYLMSADNNIKKQYSNTIEQIKKDDKNNFTIGTVVIHSKHGEGIISFADDTEIEVVFKNNKKVTYSKKNNELKIKPCESKKKKADIKTLYKKLFVIEDAINKNEKIETEIKLTLQQEIKDIFLILDAKFQSCNE